MNKRIISLFLILIVSLSPLFSQNERKVSYDDLTWFGDFTKAKLTSKFSAYFDFALRRRTWLAYWSQTVFRPGMIYSLNDHINLAAGFAHYDSYSSKYIKPESQVWEQIQFSHHLGKLTVSQRIGLEERYIKKIVNNEVTNEYTYVNRFRYQLSAQVLLYHFPDTPKKIYLVFSEEVMLNFGNEAGNNNFDQNRIAGGIGFKFFEQFDVTVSYMNLFQLKGQTRTYENDNAIVMNFYHNFDLRKEKK